MHIILLIQEKWNLNRYCRGQCHVVSPYEFMSKTHSLSTEDLGKFFIDWLIHLSTPQEPFTSNRKLPIKWIKMPIKLEKKVENSITHCCHAKLKRLCSGSMSKYRNQLKTSLKIRKKYPQNKSDILCCHDIEVAVFIVQGPHLNIEWSHENR